MQKYSAQSQPVNFPSIPSYTITNFIAAGAMGKVFAAIDVKSHRKVAIKVVHAHLNTPETNARFLREITVMKKVSHPNIVQIYGHGVCDNGSHYMVMQYVSGTEVNNILNKKGSLSPTLSLMILRQSAVGLAYAHRHGIIHRDIKPHNLMFDKQTKQVLLVDFGIAKAFDSQELTQDGSVLGSPSFMSPEQATGKHLTDKSDIYALGAVFYKLITGKNLYHGNTAVDVIVQHVKASIPKFPNSHRKLQPLLDIMCSKDARDRPAAASVVKIISALLQDEDIKDLPAITLSSNSKQDDENTIILSVLESTRATSASTPKAVVVATSRADPILKRTLAFGMMATIAFLAWNISSIKPLTITTSYPLAHIHIDNQEVGIAPITITDLSDGEHEIYALKEISTTERWVSFRQVKTPLQGDSIRLRMDKQFLVQQKWLNEQDYQQHLKKVSAEKNMQHAFDSLNKGDLFSRQDSAYLLYLKAVKYGANNPSFLMALDKKTRELANAIYLNEGINNLKVYMATVEGAWEKRPWMSALLEKSEVEIAQKRKAIPQPTPQKSISSKKKEVPIQNAVPITKKDCSYCPSMVAIQAGRANLGIAATYQGNKHHEKPTYQVNMPPFYIQQYLITVEQYALFLNAGHGEAQQHIHAKKANISHNNNTWAAEYSAQNLPMAYVTYTGAQNYCKWLGSITKKMYRLPTEPEWEYAAKAGTTSHYWWGNTAKLGMANTLGIGGTDQWSKVSPVSAFPANPWGLHDMGGNLWQWTSSMEKNKAVIKGGSWVNPIADTHPARRVLSSPSLRSSKIGFRCISR